MLMPHALTLVSEDVCEFACYSVSLPLEMFTLCSNVLSADGSIIYSFYSPRIFPVHLSNPFGAIRERMRRFLTLGAQVHSAHIRYAQIDNHK